MNDWPVIISNLTEGVDITVDPARWNLDNSEYYKIYSMWKEANFNLDSIKWTNYYPGIHFPQEIIDQQMEHLKLTRVHRAWISKLDPGFMAPWHWDVDDNEEEYLKHGPITRYTVMVEAMANGHILIIGNDHYFDQPENTVIKWANYREWHSGVNAGMKPNYMLHILGS